jgi:ribonuclease HI
MILYADGSSNTADKSGGWAWWVSDELCDSGYANPATNNTMEINAVLQGLLTLEWHDLQEPLEIVSDSAYVINCMKDRWYLGWRKRGWRVSSGEPVKNQELWEQLIEVVERFPANLIWTHVRGHGRGANDPAHHVLGNDIVDRLAGVARRAGLAGHDAEGQRAARLVTLSKDPAPKRKRKLTMKQLDDVVFVIDGGHRYVALDIEEDGRTVLLLEEEK